MPSSSIHSPVSESYVQPSSSEYQVWPSISSCVGLSIGVPIVVTFIESPYVESEIPLVTVLVILPTEVTTVGSPLSSRRFQVVVSVEE